MPRRTTTIPSASSIPALANRCRSGAHEVRQHLTLSVGTPAAATRAGCPPVVVGVDEVEEEVARAVVRQMRDLASDPQRPVARESAAERAVHRLVEPADGEDVGVRVAVELGVVGARAIAGRAGGGPAAGGVLVLVGRGGQGRSLGIEELTGAAGHADTLPMRCAVTGRVGRVAQSAVTVSRPGGRGTDRQRDRVEEGRDSAEQGAG